jgi:hypothetical protein
VEARGIPRVPIWKGPKTVQVLERVREEEDIGYCIMGFMTVAVARGMWNRSFMARAGFLNESVIPDWT